MSMKHWAVLLNTQIGVTKPIQKIQNCAITHSSLTIFSKSTYVAQNKRSVVCCSSVGGFESVKYLALAHGTFRAVFGPSGAAEASDSVLIHAGLGHVVPDGVGQAGVHDAAWAALPLRDHRKLAVRHRRTRHGPAVHLSSLRNADILKVNVCPWWTTRSLQIH